MSEENLCPIGRKWTSRHCSFCSFTTYFFLATWYCLYFSPCDKYAMGGVQLKCCRKCFPCNFPKNLKDNLPITALHLSFGQIEGEKTKSIPEQEKWHIKVGNWLRIQRSTVKFHVIKCKIRGLHWEALNYFSTLERTKKEVQILMQEFFFFFYRCDVFVQHA